MRSILVVKRRHLSWIVALLPLAACGGGHDVLIVARADAGDAASVVDRPPPSHGDARVVDLASDAGLEIAPDASSEASSDEASADTSVPTSPFCTRGVDVAGVTPPAGFCLKLFAKLPEPRSIVFAPDGDLFVAAPSSPTPGGASGGPGAIVLLSDDDHDGVAELHTFLARIDAATSLADVHALALVGGFLSFTTQADVWRTPYVDGQRAASGAPEAFGLPATFGTGGRWTHGLASSKTGALFASRGAYAQCGASLGGEISAVGPGGVMTTVASGFRNPMYLRCHPTDDVCAATELGEDLETGATEKMVVLHPSTSYGYPCCLDNAVPAQGVNMACGDVSREDATFPLSDTPFGFDWEPGAWPAPFTGAIFVALHGSAYSSPPWHGVGIVYAPTNPTTHAPTQDWQTFFGAFGSGDTVLRRPSDVAFAPDGRMFFADDTGGAIYWMAPVTLAPAPQAR